MIDASKTDHGLCRTVTGYPHPKVAGKVGHAIVRSRHRNVSISEATRLSDPAKSNTVVDSGQIVDVEDEATVQSEPSRRTSHSKGDPRPYIRGCHSCYGESRRCDGRSPCSYCTKNDRLCVPRSRKTQRKGEWCKGCSDRKLRCDGKRPCGRCAEDQLTCQDRDDKQKTPRLRPGERCARCRRESIRCDGLRPCGPCTRDDQFRKDQDLKPRKKPSKGHARGARCQRCRAKSFRCDGKRPCGPCREDGRVCEDQIVSRRTTKARAGMKKVCLRHSRSPSILG